MDDKFREEVLSINSDEALDYLITCPFSVNVHYCRSRKNLVAGISHQIRH